MSDIYRKNYISKFMKYLFFVEEREMSQTKVVEKIKTINIHLITFFENRAVDEIKWKNTLQADRSQMTIWRMRIACCITKATELSQQLTNLMHKFSFYNKFIVRLYMFQEIKIVLYSVWHHHTETSEWSKITKIQFYRYEHTVVKLMCEFFECVYFVLLTVNMLYHVDVMFIQLLK